MEKLLTQEDIRSLKEFNSRLAMELKSFGITIETVPEELTEQLDEYAEVQLSTGLSDMDANKLREFCLNKKKQQLDQRLAASKLKIEVDDLKKQIETETKECELLEKFINKHANAKVDYQSMKMIQKKKLESLELKQQSFQKPEDIDMDELIKKTELLKQLKGNSKK